MLKFERSITHYGVCITVNDVKLHSSSPEHYSNELYMGDGNYYIVSRFGITVSLEAFDSTGYPLFDICATSTADFNTLLKAAEILC